MRPRVALATYEKAPKLAPDDQLLIPVLAEHEIDAEPAVWSSDDVIWETFDAIVIRSCWDYHLRYDAFRAWLDRLDASRLPVFNPPSLVAWNSMKHYLLDLGARGVQTVPTRIVPRGGVEEVAAIVRDERWDRFVIKPAISASGYQTHSFERFDDAARGEVARVVSLGETLVQPFVDEIPRDGELSLVFIDGTFSHSAIKRAKEGEFRVQTEHGGSVSPVDVDRSVVDEASRVLAALDERALYARVDGVVRNGTFALMELELIEPNLFFELRPESLHDFSAALDRRLKDA